MKMAITVDIEKDIGFMDSSYGIDEGLPFLLGVFRKYNLQATFFISGEITELLQDRGLLKEIVRDNHEIASHGYTHIDYREWPYSKIVKEICKSKERLENSTERNVKGYRAPQFLLNEKIIKAVKECGFLYDSSLPDRSGIGAAKVLRKVKTDNSFVEMIHSLRIKEFPIDSIPILKIPHGILWINLITLHVYKLLFNFIKKDFMMFYLHPFDLVKGKNRITLDLKRKIFYLKNQNRIHELLETLIQFWISKGIKFVKFEDQL